MTNDNEFIHRVLSYRLSAVDAMALACKLKMKWDAAVPIEIWFDGRKAIEGLSTAYTGPAIEAGVVHGRALLEFLGLRTDPKDHHRLTQRRGSRSDDYCIEKFSNKAGPLPLVSPAAALAGYTGPPEEAERAFAYVMHLANKGVAHSTDGLLIDAEDDALLELAARGIRILFTRHFYRPLGLETPTSHVQVRSVGQAGVGDS